MSRSCSFSNIVICPLFVFFGTILLLIDADNKRAKENADKVPAPIPVAKSLTPLDLVLGLSIRSWLAYTYIKRHGLDFNAVLGFIFPFALSFTSWGLHIVQKNFCIFGEDTLRHATSIAHGITTVSHIITYHRICSA